MDLSPEQINQAYGAAGAYVLDNPVEAALGALLIAWLMLRRVLWPVAVKSYGVYRRVRGIAAPMPTVDDPAYWRGLPRRLRSTMARLVSRIGHAENAVRDTRRDHGREIDRLYNRCTTLSGTLDTHISAARLRHHDVNNEIKALREKVSPAVPSLREQAIADLVAEMRASVSAINERAYVTVQWRTGNNALGEYAEIDQIERVGEALKRRLAESIVSARVLNGELDAAEYGQPAAADTAGYVGETTPSNPLNYVAEHGDQLVAEGITDEQTVAAVRRELHDVPYQLPGSPQPLQLDELGPFEPTPLKQGVDPSPAMRYWWARAADPAPTMQHVKPEWAWVGAADGPWVPDKSA